MQNASGATTLSVVMNEFMTPNGISLDQLKAHFMESNFFFDEMDARCAVTMLIPSMTMLSQLTAQYVVTVKIWAKKEPGHPGWDFSCEQRGTAAEAACNMRFNMDHSAGITDSIHAGMHRQPDMGMGMKYQPYDHPFNHMGSFRPGVNIFPGNGGGLNESVGIESVGNGLLVELLGAYVLTQIHPLPSSSRRRGLPHGLELLEMVKQRLRFQPTMVNPASMMGGATMWMNNQPSGHMFGGNPMFGMQAKPNRFVLVEVPTSGYNTNPPKMEQGDEHRGVAYDLETNLLVHYAANRVRGSYGVYDCARDGNLLRRTEYMGGDEWTQHLGLDTRFGIQLIPSKWFTFQVSDKNVETIHTVVKMISALFLPMGLCSTITNQVTDVLRHKPIDSSKFSMLTFTMGSPRVMPEGLEASIGDPTLPAWTTESSPCWIIHTGVQKDPTEMPENFWVLTDETPRSNMF